MFIIIDTYRSFSPGITVGWALGLFCGAVVLSWLYNRSGGSILLVAVWQATYNLISGTNAATRLLAATSTTLVIALAIALVVLKSAQGEAVHRRSWDQRTRPGPRSVRSKTQASAATPAIGGAFSTPRFASAPRPDLP